MKKIITCESVFQGHPDKVCDQISDAILDECLKQDKHSRVAVECCIKDNFVLLIGEITTKAKVDYKAVVSNVLLAIGYTEPFTVVEKISKQSPDIALGVDKEGAGDQGMMYGYACKETKELLPLPLVLAHKISQKIDWLRKEKYSHLFGPDGKCQVSVEYEDDTVVGIKTIIVSAQTKPKVKISDIEPIIIHEVLAEIIPNLQGTKVLINPTGAFEIGGPYADSGLTGRKIIVDTCGGVAHHGGGAFSGKDPSKVDRSAAYYCRYVAKSIVASGICTKCEIGVSYSIGIAEPISIVVDTFGTCENETKLNQLINSYFNFKPSAIINELRLREIEYRPLACYGHFGRSELPWEQVDDKAQEIRKAW